MGTWSEAEVQSTERNIVILVDAAGETTTADDI